MARLFPAVAVCLGACALAAGWLLSLLRLPLKVDVYKRQVLYLVDSHYGTGDGIERLFFSAYDLQQRRLLANDELKGGSLLAMKVTPEDCFLLTTKQDAQWLELTVYDRQGVRLKTRKQYDFPAPWRKATATQAHTTFPSFAMLAEPYLCVLYPYTDEETAQNLVYLTVYDLASTEITYLVCFAMENATVDIRAMRRL